MKSINEKQMIDQISAQTGETKVIVNRVWDKVWDCIQDELEQGNKVIVRNFGSFSTVERKARVGRNPKTGKELVIPAKVVAKFKPGKGLELSVA